MLIATCCFIFVCLGYVELFRGVTHKVNDPNTREFWQVRNLAMQWRSPAGEAREAFERGEYDAFSTAGLATPVDSWIAQTRVEVREPAVMATASATELGSWLSSLWITADPEQEVLTHHQKYLDSSSAFALEYNRELTRLMNRR